MRHAFGSRQRASFPATTSGTSQDNSSSRPIPTTLKRNVYGSAASMTAVSVETIAGSVPDDCDATDSYESIDLAELLPEAKFFGADSLSVQQIATEASECEAGDVVVCRIGEGDPNIVIAEALARGAAGILTEQLLPCPLPQCIVGSVDHALAKIASHRNNHPDRKLLTVGVLGQSGKTSTCLMLATLTNALGVRTAYQCDLGVSDGVVSDTPKLKPAMGADLVEWLGESSDCMSRVALVEISEQGAREGHYDAIEFDVLIVTGKSEATEDFGPCSLSCLLERLSSSGIVILPQSDQRSFQMVEASENQCIRYGTTADCEFSAISIDQSGGMSTLMLCAGDTSAMIETPLCGQGMAANLAATTALGVLLGHSPHEIAEHLSKLRSIPGRGHRLVEFGQATVVLETGGGIDRVSDALKTAKASGAGGRVWCVMAIGESDGEDDLANYGHIMERFAHHTVVTSHPNQTGSFLKRSHHVLDGVKECAAVRLVADQKRAIQWAMESAEPRDTVVVILNRRSQVAFENRSEIETIKKIVDETREANPVAKLEEVADAGAPIKLKLFR